MNKKILLIGVLSVLLIAGCNIPDTLDDPFFSPNPDDSPFEGPLTITIDSPTDDARIYYTLDGSEPEEDDDLLYEEPIVIDKSTLVKAIAYKDDVLLSSQIISGKFIIE